MFQYIIVRHKSDHMMIRSKFPNLKCEYVQDIAFMYNIKAYKTRPKPDNVIGLFLSQPKFYALNKNQQEIMLQSYVTLMKDYIKNGCNVKLFSNGSRLLQEKEWIADEMLKGVVFRLTFHRPPYTQAGKKDWENGYEFTQYLIERGVDIDNMFELSEAYLQPDNTPRIWFDLVKYQFNEDGSVKYYPHEDGNPSASFEHCTCANSQLYNGHLWKCPMVAYLRESLAATDQLEDPEWQKYLGYKPTSINDTDDALRNSFKEVVEPGWICNMCPSRPKIEYAAKIQLKGQKKTVEMFNPKNYEPV